MYINFCSVDNLGYIIFSSSPKNCINLWHTSYTPLGTPGTLSVKGNMHAIAHAIRNACVNVRTAMNARDVRTGLQRRVVCCHLHLFLVVLSISLAFLTSKEAWIVTNTRLGQMQMTPYLLNEALLAKMHTLYLLR